MGIELELALGLALVWGFVWAAVLQCTEVGRWLALQRTWITVVVGVGVDLGLCLLVVSWGVWWRVALVMVLSSVGIIGRSLLNEWRERQVELERAARGARGKVNGREGVAE